MTKLRKLIQDEKGSITPIIASILIACILIGAVNISLSMVYRDRTVVRDALDAACTSSLVGATEERWRPLEYSEQPIINVTGTYDVSFEYIPVEDKEKSYIFINRELAEEIAEEVFKKNLELNAVPYKLNDFNIEIEYEPHTASKHSVLKERYEVTKQPDNWWITEELYNPDEIGQVPSSWNVNIYRDVKQVKFPRWVRVRAIANVELSTPLGKLVGSRESVDVVLRSEAVRELETGAREESE